MDTWIAWLFILASFIIGFICGALWMRGELYCAVPFKMEKRNRGTR